MARLSSLLGRSLFALVASALVPHMEARGHTTGENYVWVNIEKSHLQGWFEIRFDDLRTKLDLDIPTDVEAAREVVVATAPAVQAYIREHFRLLAEGKEAPYEFTDVAVHEVPNLGHFAQYYYQTESFEIPDRITIYNNLFFENDKFHRSLIAIQYNKKAGEEYGDEFASMVFSDFNNEQELDLTDVHGLLRPRDFIWQGMLHIWIGLDHILFLVALLLPVVLVREEGRWVPATSFRSALWNVVKIVTLFTVAHSITLSLAALDLVELSSQLVESLIALSIVIVSLNALSRRFQEGNGLIIFFFGLFHGLGFASVMGYLPFRMMDLVGVLFGFNVGVELGQLAIVGCVFPLLFALRNQGWYVPVVLKAGSMAICLIAAYWFVERAFGL